MKERVALSKFHTLLHPYNTSLVSCCDSDGKANIITIAWVIPVSVEPPFIGMSIRPTRYSYQLIKETGEFVINVAPYALAEQALLCGRRSGRDINKFTKTGLTPRMAVRIQPPIIEECLAHLECRMVKDIQAGDHRFLLGEVLNVSIDPKIIDQHGLYDLSLVNPLLHIGRDRFTTVKSYFTEPMF